MGRYILYKFFVFILSLLCAAAVIFFLLEVLPGDPATVMLGIGAQEDTLLALRKQLGVDKPIVVRFFVWLGGLLSGDLGTSYTYNVPVSELILDRLQVSLPLAIFALILSTAVAIPLGVLAASRANSFFDYTLRVTAQLGIALPNFWFAILLVIVFAINLRWFNAGGFNGWQNPLLAMKSLLLPAVSLALPQAAILARVTRSSLLNVLSEDFIRTSRASGLSFSYTLWHNALPNAFIPIITIMGMQFSFLISGAIIIENVFTLPGLGRLIFQSIAGRDLIVVKNSVLIMVALVIFVNFVVDILYAVIDPRLKSSH